MRWRDRLNLTGQRQQQFFENALERVRALPGVEGAGAISQPPLGGSGVNWFRVDGEPVPSPSERPEAKLRAMAGDYFRTIVGAVTALGLALVGVYGVLTHGVSQRSREIAIRGALGATHTDVIALVVRDATRFAAAGIALGVAAALAITRSLSALLYGVTSADAMTYGLVAVVLAVVCVTVSWLPGAARCTRGSGARAACGLTERLLFGLS